MYVKDQIPEHSFPNAFILSGHPPQDTSEVGSFALPYRQEAEEQRTKTM